MTKRRMGAQEVVKVDKGCQQAIGAVKGTKAAFLVIPGFKLTVKRFDEVVGNDIVEVFNPDMTGLGEKQFNRLLISKIPVRDNRGSRCPKLITAALNQAKSTVGVAIR